MSIKLAIDFGLVRIGIAKSDPAGTVAVPLITLANDENLWQNLKNLINDSGASAIYVGLPLNLKGEVTKSANLALDFAKELQALIKDIPIKMVDERFSSKGAQIQLREAGLNTKKAKGLVDQVSAAAVLDQALIIEQRTGSLAGSDPKEWTINDQPV